MTEPTILLGYAMGTGTAVRIPVRHMAVTGITQESGKTTTLEALIARSGLRALCFITKRGESAFQSARRIAPYCAIGATWQYVESLLEAYLDEDCAKLRLYLMQACAEAKTLQDVAAKVKTLHAESVSKSEIAHFYMLSIYLAEILRDLGAMLAVDANSLAAAGLELHGGLNAIDVAGFPRYLQGVVIASVLDWIAEHETGVVTVIPEAWEMIPRAHGSPCKAAAERLVRKGACCQNFLWLDSQDLAAIGIEARKACTVYLLGVQREANEVARTLRHLPGGDHKPTAAQIMQLERGWFYFAYGRELELVYVQPTWLDADPERARRYAREVMPKSYVAPPAMRKAKRTRCYKFTDQQLEQAEKNINDELARQCADAEGRVQ